MNSKDQKAWCRIVRKHSHRRALDKCQRKSIKNTGYLSDFIFSFFFFFCHKAPFCFCFCPPTVTIVKSQHQPKNAKKRHDRCLPEGGCGESEKVVAEVPVSFE